jgi:N-formylglutamate amidohydrolase
LCFAEARQRVDGLYYPYHQTLCGLIQETEEAFGGCLLIDCHSMPSAAGMVGGQEAADFVLGDCHGTSCAPRIIEAARSFLAEREFTVALNAPYSGGFTTGHYGCPEQRRHALQIEINRALYMDERNYRRKPAFSRLADDMAGLIERLGQVVRECLAHTADCGR